MFTTSRSNTLDSEEVRDLMSWYSKDSDNKPFPFSDERELIRSCDRNGDGLLDRKEVCVCVVLLRICVCSSYRYMLRSDFFHCSSGG